MEVSAAASPQCPHSRNPQGRFRNSPSSNGRMQPVQGFPEPVLRLLPPPTAELAIYGSLVRRIRSRHDKPSVIAGDSFTSRMFDLDSQLSAQYSCRRASSDCFFLVYRTCFAEDSEMALNPRPFLFQKVQNIINWCVRRRSHPDNPIGLNFEPYAGDRLVVDEYGKRRGCGFQPRPFHAARRPHLRHAARRPHPRHAAGRPHPQKYAFHLNISPARSSWRSQATGRAGPQSVALHVRRRNPR